MAATYMPSNLVTQDPRLELNPNWGLTETAVPIASVLTEDIHDRLFMCVARHPYADSPNYDKLLNVLSADKVNTEQSAVFVCNNFALQNCTGFQLEQITLNLPMNGVEPGGRNLTTTLCGDFLSDDYSDPRRFVFSPFDMLVPLTINSRVYTFNMTNILPYQQAIAYYRLSDMINFFVTGITSFMQNVIGDNSFYCTVYVDNVSPRLFFYSSNYPNGAIRLVLNTIGDSNQNFMSLLQRHLFFSDYRVGDTTQAASGYPVGESLGFQAMPRTGFENNALAMTLHSADMTQYRKMDSIAPADGSTLIATLYPQNVSDQLSIFTASIKDGSMVSPKISFDRTQTLLESTFTVRVISSSKGSNPMQMKATELLGTTLLLTFRAW